MNIVDILSRQDHRLTMKLPFTCAGKRPVEESSSPERQLRGLGILLGTVVTLGALRAEAAPIEIRPVGGEFQVNTYTPGTQLSPDVASTEDGGFVVAWSGYVPSRARRFDPEGEPIGSDFLISSDLSVHFEDPPSIDPRGGSGFTIAWAARPLQGDWDVFARHFGQDGLPLGEDFEVITEPGDQTEGAFATSRSGQGSLASWRGGDTSRPLEARVFGLDCPAGCEAFGVNPDSPSGLRHESAATADGGFVVVWEEAGFNGVVAQRVSSSGQLLGSQIRLDNGEFFAWRAAVGAGDDGTSLVAWSAPGIVGGNTTAVVARRLGPDGALLEDQFRLSDPGIETSQRASVSTGDAAGTFMVAWRDGDTFYYSYETGVDGSGSAIGGRLVRDGEPLGEPLAINEYTTGSQDDPSVARSTNGTYLVVWYSPGSTGDDSWSTSIAGRLYRDNSGIFRGDFEDGETAAWSFESPSLRP